MTKAPPAVRDRKVCMLAYWDSPTALPPMFNHGVSLSADGFDVEMICLAPHAGTASVDPHVPGLSTTRLYLRSRQFFQRFLGAAPPSALAAMQWAASYFEFVVKSIAAALGARADVYEANDLPPLLPAIVAARLRGKPVVYRAHELWSEATPSVRFAGFWRLMERILVPKCDHVITPEENRSRIYHDELRARRQPMTIRNCPPYRPPAQSSRLHEELRRRGKAGSTIVLYQGLIDSMRCIEEIAEASRFFDAGVVLVVMGTGFGRWADATAALAGFERVVVLPPVPYKELAPFTASADIGVLLYRNDCRNNYYCAPNKLFEYMMMGLPVIAPNYPGMLTLVEGEGVGMCVAPDSPRAIAAAVNRLAGDPESRSQMRANGLRLSKARYNWADESAPLLQLYRSLARVGAAA